MPETDFTDFELLPDDAAQLTPTEELAFLVDPDDLPLVPTDDEEGLPFGRTVWMDFDSGVLVEDRWVDGANSVVMIAQMALRTIRGSSPYLPDWFGRNGPDPHLGHVDNAELRAIHQADIHETLMTCHDRITDVDNFRWTYDVHDTIIEFAADVEIDGEDVITLVAGI